MAPQESTISSKADVPRRLQIKVNGINYTVGPEVLPWTTLIDYLRLHLKLPGTKVLCREGGCGACTIVATISDQEVDGAVKTFSVQACQVLVYTCSGWNIETIEYLGDRYKGYHSLQKALAGFYGTQCGYCSPGMIMTMYGQLKASGSLTASQVEKSLDGNLCRCTGYRPILDAFKSFAVDADACLKKKLTDIEDAYTATCPKSGKACTGSCGSDVKAQEQEEEKKNGAEESMKIQPLDVDIKWTVGDVQWYRPVTLMGIRNVLQGLAPSDKVRLVVGNTGQGVYKNDGPYDAYISTCGVKELYAVRLQSPLTLGANVSLSRCIEVFDLMAQNPGYKYLKELKEHWQNVANVSVRNVGSWAGNLVMKHQHREFPSDIFLTLLAADAALSIRPANSDTPFRVGLEQFLTTDMTRSFIVSMTLPPIPDTTLFRTFKVTPRAVNAHAYVNACFKMTVDKGDGYKVTETPTILFGGINSTFMHAKKTENYLLNKKLTEVVTVVEAAVTLGTEIKPSNDPHDASPAYRTSLSQCLLYKTIVGFLGDNVSEDIRSAGSILERPLSSGQQDFDMNQETWPVGQGIPKVESATQISGEALYMDDIPCLSNELHGAFVQTTVANAKIKSVDTREALAVPGVKTYITTEDIPGINSYTAKSGAYEDPIFVADRVKYAGQAIGLIVADTRDTAVRAAKLVRVEYEDIKKPILTIEEALKVEGRSEICKNWETGKQEPLVFGNVEDGLRDSKHKLTGELHQGTQFHLTIEPYAGRVVPIEDGYDVFCTTQWPTETQAVIANVLSIPTHSINVEVRRIGGGYGGKISRSHVTVAAAAVAVNKLKQPVRVVLDLNTCMTIAGWREPYLSKYEVGFDDNGKFQALKVDMMGDAGHVRNDSAVGFLSGPLQNCYYIPNMLFRPIIVSTDTAANTWCRTPGTVEALATVENIIEHIAHYLKKDPLEVREVNMVPPAVPRLMVPPHKKNVVKDDILPLLKQKAMYEQRKSEIKLFNQENKWKKRGMTVIPLLYGLNYPSMFRYGVQIAVYQHDGTVAVSHGGIEMGQGINTKVAQVVAYKLGIPMDLVIIKKSDTLVGANSSVTGGSFGSDLCAHGAKVACEALLTRMNVIKENMKKNKKKDPTWIELVRKCHDMDVDLCERYWTAGKEHPPSYEIWAACCLEVEVDILTGQYLIRRADIVEDSGRSMNPYVDIGQVEGAFVMGLGLYTSEIVKFNTETGEKLSDGTWDYKPPTALDIPVDLRVTLLPNASNPYGVLGSKATGEPPLCLTYGVVTALRQAISAFKEQNGNTDWFDMDTPLTVEKVQQLCGVRTDQFKLVSLTDEDILKDYHVINKDEVPEVSDESSAFA